MASRVFCCGGKDEFIRVLEKFREHKDWLDDEDKTATLKFGDSCDEKKGQPPSVYVMDFLLKIYRRHCRKSFLCDSVFHLNDQLVALQLVMAQKNKEEHSEFHIGLQEVLETHEKICQQKLGLAEFDDKGLSHLIAAYDEFLCYCNASDYVGVLQQIKAHFILDEPLRERYQSSFQYAFLGKPKTHLEKELFKLLAGSRETVVYHSGEDLSDRQVEDVLTLVPGKMPNVPASPTSCSSPSQGLPSSPSVVSKAQVLRVILAYLRLLVNSRDELALVQAINLPDRGLGHREFTVLRKVARKKKMPMFQTAVSFVIQIRLGGKSYAPKGDNPLLPITKGLAEFVAFFQKLQNILEENPEPRASVLRIINIIRVSLLRAKERPFPSQCVDEAVKGLERVVEEVASKTNQRSQEEESSSMVGMKSLLLIQDLLDQSDGVTSGIHSGSNVHHVLTTPIQSAQGQSRIRSLLTQFRTPDSPSPEKIQIPEKHLKRTEKKIDPIKRMCGEMSWAKPSVTIAASPLCRKKKSPLKNRNDSTTRSSKTLEELAKETPKSHSRKRPAESEQDKENVPMTGRGADSQEIHKPPAKRLALGKDTAKPKPKRTTGAAKPRKKKPVLLEGQKQLTLFFR